MTKTYRINRDVYEAIANPAISNFCVTEVRKHIQSVSDAYGSVSNARQFVARQLDKLEKAGLAVSRGSKHNKVYSKTSAFNETKFELKDKRTRSLRVTNISLKSTPLYTTLQREKSDIEAELTITLEEIKEYKTLMKRSKDLCRLLDEPHSNTTKKAALLVAKLNVWSEALKRLSKNEPVPC
ncbi:hypothetical protein [Vibrio europaeus]|uniref:Transcriptional regulator VspR n=1 Tax=Vibrio europaeus TaxID=300876 RepID=A0A178J624_9VIBR|nr:hypothetical protein [Vibrio europaeus]MDC5706172.1 hypothetical protein [Vibrio europaeus]MDC5709582.1 hypothetical protein [Vibrio europaeus]MDC5713981.1 hypothetical protein [Vibrio europaeus]MDC5723410.1 hypothetical protein [Vibrio europaeus]MDC5730547.1 hypothetical protein [Vibrio europaeus]